jgi:hypothetical protein
MENPVMIFQTHQTARESVVPVLPQNVMDLVFRPVRGVETDVSPDEGSRLLLDALGDNLFRKLGAYAVILGMLLKSLGEGVNRPKPRDRQTSQTLISEA